MIMSTAATKLRLKLTAAGFCPLPLVGKRPVLEEWQKRIDASTGDIEIWSKLFPQALNTGALTRLMPALDIDIKNPEAADAVEQLVRERFEDGGYILTRFGQPPKRAIPFRTNTPFSKIATGLVAPDGSTDQKLELLCNGQQLVVAGIHPDTGKPYAWFGGEPGTIKLEELPYLHEEEARALVNDAAALLVRDFGYTRPQTKGSNTGNGFDRDTSGWSTLIEHIHAGRELHDSIRDLAAKLIAASMNEGAAVNLLRDMLQCSTVPHDDRFDERLADVPRAVRSAARKFHAEVAREQTTEPRRPLLWPYTPRAFAAIPRRRWLHAGQRPR
jgi:hypothetical protein